MTKIEYIDFIRNSLQMVDKTAKFHQEQVAAAINNAVNTVFYDMYKANPKIIRKSMERYTSYVTSFPAVSGDTDRYASTLTVDVVDLPRKTGGIIEIMFWPAFATTTTITKFIPLSTMEGEQLYGSESSLPDNVIGYSFSGAREIEYWNMTALEAADGVQIRLIKQFRSHSSTTNVVLPYGQDERIIELVRQYLGLIPPKDIINTNVDGQYK